MVVVVQLSAGGVKNNLKLKKVNIDDPSPFIDRLVYCLNSMFRDRRIRLYGPGV